MHIGDHHTSSGPKNPEGLGQTLFLEIKGNVVKEKARHNRIERRIPELQVFGRHNLESAGISCPFFFGHLDHFSGSINPHAKSAKARIKVIGQESGEHAGAASQIEDSVRRLEGKGIEDALVVRALFAEKKNGLAPIIDQGSMIQGSAAGGNRVSFHRTYDSFSFKNPVPVFWGQHCGPVFRPSEVATGTIVGLLGLLITMTPHTILELRVGGSGCAEGCIRAMTLHTCCVFTGLGMDLREFFDGRPVEAKVVPVSARADYRNHGEKNQDFPP
jgi:hypothetical protein